jgi:hydroxyethylthiazole kinase-like uncharacterized protein yjeF
MKIVNVNQMQKAERDCAQFGVSLTHLMENAGKAVADELVSILGDVQKQSITILVGPGNNGGDGLVATRYLHDKGALVTVFLCGKRPENDGNLEKARRRGIRCFDTSIETDLSQLHRWLLDSNAVLDAVFGTGASRPLGGIFARVLNIVNDVKKKHPQLRVIALDLPSGLNADTGIADTAAPHADNTITLGFPKIGLFNLGGGERAGVISVVDIGIPSELVDYVNLEYLTAEWAKLTLPRRPLTSHKGSFGKVLAFVGSFNYTGAAYLACTGSLRTGAGLTTLAVTRSLLPILASKLTEATYLPLPESAPGIISMDASETLKQQLSGYDVLLLGCGLGKDQATAKLVESVLFDAGKKLPPVVLDADGLNILAGIPGWGNKFPGDAVFTPHPGEMSRLLNKSVEEIQNKRIETSYQAAASWNKIIVLKGAYTVIAAPDGRVRVSPFANPGLASAGTGDVLAGAIAGMAAQGLSLFDAASCGVYLHGQAAQIAKEEIGDAGMLASDLLPMLPRAIRQLKGI